MNDPRDPIEFSDMSDNPENDGWGWNRESPEPYLEELDDIEDEFDEA